ENLGAAGSRGASAGASGSMNARHIERRCPQARKAVKFYSARVRYWTQKMGAVGSRGASAGASGSVTARYMEHRCPRYLARVLRAKAYGLRRAYGRWWEHEWHWQA